MIGDNRARTRTAIFAGRQGTTAITASSSKPGASVPAASPTRISSRPFLIWAILSLALFAATLMLAVSPEVANLETRFVAQDLPVLLLVAIFLGALRLWPRSQTVAHDALASRSGGVVAGLALMVLVVGAVGWSLVYQRQPLSFDEFMAVFDADAIRHGHASSVIAPQWRPFTTALQPIFMFVWPDGSHWSSSYLPMNALFRALFGLFGADFLETPVWGALSVVCVYAIARRLWPGDRTAALVAAILLATSPQVLVTAMSPYAMSAHLALNLAWLVLILRDRRWSDAAAICVGFAACGLHQIAFHPLFVAPFIAQFWLDRRWRRGLIFTIAYAAICAFWAQYWSLMVHLGGGAASAAAHGDGSSFLDKVVQMVSAPNPDRFGLMTRNLLRFVTWQNPLAITLGLAALLPAWRQGGVLRALVAGLLLTLIFMLIAVPMQGHGWGYRYVHGLLGSVCLIAAFGWMRAIGAAAGETRRSPGDLTAVLACSAFSLLVLLPLRAFQVHQFIAPSARAQLAIDHADTDVVLVDPDQSFYVADLVRNAPSLTNRPKVMNLYALSLAQIESLCRTQSVALFDRSDAVKFGVSMDPRGKWSGAGDSVTDQLDDADLIPDLREAVHAHCGDRHVTTLGRR